MILKLTKINENSVSKKLMSLERKKENNFKEFLKHKDKSMEFASTSVPHHSPRMKKKDKNS